MARALRSVLDPGLLTVVVNVGDDTERYGVHVSADPDTVLYTLAGEIGSHGWGRADDTFTAMDELSDLGFDTTFRLGDKDLALCMARTLLMEEGWPLSRVTATLAARFDLEDLRLLPATDDPLRTWIQTGTRDWIEFQEYFVGRKHDEDVVAVAYRGSPDARPAPGVVDAISNADTLVIAPSNPPLSIWPILAVDRVNESVRAHPNTVAVSPLFGGVPLKGPADRVMHGVGLSAGTRGVLEAYDQLIDTLFVDSADEADVSLGPIFDVEIVPADTRLTGDDMGAGFASLLVERGLR